MIGRANNGTLNGALSIMDLYWIVKDVNRIMNDPNGYGCEAGLMPEELCTPVVINGVAYPCRHGVAVEVYRKRSRFSAQRRR